MKVEFPYLNLARGYPLRPYILVSIFYRQGIEKTLALLDSGADLTLIPLHIARRIGLRLSPKHVKEVYGVGGSVTAYRTQATLIFSIGDENEFTLSDVKVLVPEDSYFRYTLLGRDTIFKKFIISFDEYDKKVIFEEKYP